MLFASLGGYRIEGAFKRGASCALFFEEGTQIDNTVESFVQNADKAKTCGLGSTTNVVPLSQARGIRGLQYFPTQMVDGPMLAPNYTNLSSGSGNGMRFPAQVTPDWVFSTFLCAQGHPETVTTLDDVEVDSHLGYGLTTRQHVRVGTPNLLTGYRKMFLGNQSSDLRLSVGEGRSASTSSVLSTTYMYGIGWDVGWVRPTTASQYAYGLMRNAVILGIVPRTYRHNVVYPNVWYYMYNGPYTNFKCTTHMYGQISGSVPNTPDYRLTKAACPVFNGTQFMCEVFDVGDSSADIVQDADCTVGQQFTLSTKDIPLPEIADTISL